MREISPGDAADYLRETGRVPADVPIDAQVLGGGVSNLVLRVEVAGRAPIVLKQARARLRTRMRWVSRLERIWTETAALRLLAPAVPPGAVPEVLWEDREHFLFAMSCAPDDSVAWKGGSWPARPIRGSPVAPARCSVPCIRRSGHREEAGGRWPIGPSSTSCGSTRSIAPSRRPTRGWRGGSEA